MAFKEKWQMKKVKNVITDIKSGFPFSRNKLVYKGIPQLRPYNITTNLSLDLSTLVYVPSTIKDIETYFLKEGDILFNNTNSVELVGKSAIVRKEFDACFSNHISRLRVERSIVEPKWLALCFQRHWLQGNFMKICRRWIGQSGINSTILKEIDIPVPSLKVQKAIIARIEELATRIEEAKRLKDITRNETEVIMVAAQSRIFTHEFEKKWNTKRLIECFEKINSGSTPRKQADNYVTRDGVPFIKVEHITKDGNVLINHNNAMINRSLHSGIMNRSKVSGKTILVNIVGPPLGKVGIIPNDINEANINQAIVALRDPICCIPEYVLYCLRSPLYNRKLINLGVGIRQYNINISQVREFKIPVPPLDIQKKIIGTLDKIRNYLKEVIKLQEQTQKEIDTMTASILDIAFKGELVPYYVDGKSAPILLEEKDMDSKNQSDLKMNDNFGDNSAQKTLIDYIDDHWSGQSKWDNINSDNDAS
jgi:type I restriction enzyme S subunit